MFISLKRTIIGGWVSFARNIGLNIGTIFVILMAVLLVSFLFIFNIAAEDLISKIQARVDISVYFKEDVLPENIMEIQAEIKQIPEVKEVSYTSKEEALSNFIERHKNEPIVMESLAEVGDNPFLPSLNIKVMQASQYEQINSFLKESSFNDSINRIDYYQRKPVIEKVFSVTNSINTSGVIVSILLGLIAALIAFNTIRIAICNSSEEISTMRLVGASNWFIRGPFLIQGAISGVFASIVAVIVTFLASYALNSKVLLITGDISILKIFLGSFLTLFFIQIITGIGLGTASSYIAIRRYLKI